MSHDVSAARPVSGFTSPPGWFRTDRPGTERWWDGARWTVDVRPASGAAPGGRAADEVPHGRITWAGVHWGSATRGVSVAGGVAATLLALPVLLVAVLEGSWSAVFLVVIALGLLFMAAVLFVNAHFCRVLDERRRTARPGRPGPHPR